jgi:hypothetical protein
MQIKYGLDFQEVNQKNKIQETCRVIATSKTCNSAVLEVSILYNGEYWSTERIVSLDSLKRGFENGVYEYVKTVSFNFQHTFTV